SGKGANLANAEAAEGWRKRRGSLKSVFEKKVSVQSLDSLRENHYDKTKSKKPNIHRRVANTPRKPIDRRTAWLDPRQKN
ncbi:MAG TPA: hypothetical protein VJ809_01645, partial [Pirellulales bacterium]|nr:hypothetical protein [Pirellulales bacterium]